MSRRARIAVMATGLVAITAVPARAEELCVGVQRAGCTEHASLADALAASAADPDLDVVFVGPDQQATSGPFADQTGRPVSIIGLGVERTRLSATGAAGAALRLSDPLSSVEAVTLSAAADAPAAVELAGVARNVRVEAPGGASGLAARLLPGTAGSAAQLVDAEVHGAVEAVGRAAVLRTRIDAADRAALLADGASVVAESVDARAGGDGTGLRVRCVAGTEASLEARHVTVTGAARSAARADCEQPPPAAAVLTIRNSILWGTFAQGAIERTGGATVTTAWSDYDPDADVQRDGSDVAVDPGFVSAADRRLASSSALVDAGDPSPLAVGEGFEDLAGFVRVVDGDGDGGVRRDIGAHELQPPPPAARSGNVLANAGAEEGDPGAPDGTGGPPAGWTRMAGAFTSVAYGAPAFPGEGAAGALAGGRALFVAGRQGAAALMQRIDVAGAAASIDSGAGTAELSGLLGGYGADADSVRVDAIFRDPEGTELGPPLAIVAPAPAERGNATNLLHRAASAGIPPRTRAVDVVIGATHRAGTYTDGYADNLALVLSVPGTPVQGPVDVGKPVVEGLRPFPGITVLSGRPPLTRRSRVRVGVACVSATVGRCSGTLELRALVGRRTRPVRIARFGTFSVGPGRRATVIMPLLVRVRRPLRAHRSFRATLIALARDGQGLERRTTVPVRVRRRER